MKERCKDVCYAPLITFSQKLFIWAEFAKCGSKTAVEYNLYPQMELSSYIQSILYFLNSKCIFYMQNEHWNVPQPQIAIRKAACLAVSERTNMTIKHGKSRWKIYFRTCSNNREIRGQLKHEKISLAEKVNPKLFQFSFQLCFFLNQGLN